MKPKTVGSLLLGFSVVFVLVGAGFALGAVPIHSILGEETATPAELIAFRSAGTTCTGDFMSNTSIRVRNDGSTVLIDYERNVSLADASRTIGEPTFERTNESAFVLRVPTVSTDKPERNCTAYARYNASMRIPAGEDRWTVLVYHDGKHVGTMWGDQNSTGASASASAGAAVSENRSE
ncbi:MAG: hypothetical protein ABEJ58_05390 [Halodesulfurarchaeum sp.]